MKVAIISDIHENFHNLVCALEDIYEKEVEKIICLGDFINNGIAKILASSKIPVFAIWGNNDGSLVTLTKTSLAENSNLTVGFSTFDIIELGNRKVFLTHYPMLAKPMAKSGDFDAVFYGHNHKKNIEKIDQCLVVNPGEISAHKTKIATYAIYDSEKNSAELFTVANSISTKTEKVSKYLENIKFKFGKSKTHQY